MNERELKERLKFFIGFMVDNGFNCDSIGEYSFSFLNEISHPKYGNCNGICNKTRKIIKIKNRASNAMTKTLFHELSHAIDEVRDFNEMENFAETWAQKIYLRFINQ